MNAIPELEPAAAAMAGAVLAGTRRRRTAGACCGGIAQHRRILVIVALGTLRCWVSRCCAAPAQRRAEHLGSVVFVTCFAVLVWLVALVLSRGTWRPRDESIAAYIDLSIHRCRSVIVAAPIGIMLYVAGLVGSLAWRQRLLGVEWQQLLQAP